MMKMPVIIKSNQKTFNDYSYREKGGENYLIQTKWKEKQQYSHKKAENVNAYGK